MKATYVLWGDPTHLFERNRSSHIFSSYQKLLIEYERQLEEMKPLLFQGYLDLNINFYLMPTECSETRRQILEGTPSVTGLTASDLAYFMKIIKKAGFVQNESSICSLSVKKYYSANPKVEFTIEEMYVTPEAQRARPRSKANRKVDPRGSTRPLREEKAICRPV